jgi:ribosome-associated protein
MGNGLHIGGGISIPEEEVHLRFVRSAGPGGQNVNKVSTRVDLLFDVKRSSALTTEQKEAIRDALRSRIGRDGVLRISAQESRSQWRNREEVTRKFAALLGRALAKKPVRVATSPTSAARKRRAAGKHLVAEKKKLRRKVFREDD